MKIIKIIVAFSVVVFGLLIVWFLLPTSIKYHEEISSGNKFIDNIKQYQTKNGKLPNEDDWTTLSTLNPLKPYETFYPEYRKLNDNNFELTYIEGFDGPYLQYDTKTNKWEKK
jgi:DNA-dependent RNA polymerase auxiliary subunit epsilon